MENLSNILVIKNIIRKYGFSFNKKLGQNFLINPKIAPKMAEMAILNNDNLGIIEIGPGIGVLTVELAKRAKKVVAIEIDKKLKPALSETLSDYKNVSVIFDDILNIDLKKLILEEFPNMDVLVCANLPYYITTPIIMKFLEEKTPVKSITIMVQKEMAQRLCTPLGKRESGAITVSIRYYSTPEILFNVSKGSFMPAPEVDSSVIKLNIFEKPPVDIENEEYFFKVVKACFSMRRKTILNCLSKGLDIDKIVVKEALEASGIAPSLRAENLLLEDFKKISDTLIKFS